MSKPRIFVSYSHQDDAFARRLVDDLQKAGAEVWYDVTGIDSGDFIGRIDEALRQCEWLVLVLTPAAIASQYVRMEVNAALHRVQQGRIRAVIPMLAAPCPPDSIPALWDVLHRFDAIRDYGSAVAGLLRAAGLSSAAGATATNSGAAAQPLNAETLITVGKLNLARKRYTSAFELFEWATQWSPTNEDAWSNLGTVLACLKRYEEALAAYDRALALDPKNTQAWRNKAISLRALGREAEAKEAERRAKKLGG